MAVIVGFIMLVHNLWRQLDHVSLVHHMWRCRNWHRHIVVAAFFHNRHVHNLVNHTRCLTACTACIFAAVCLALLRPKILVIMIAGFAIRPRRDRVLSRTRPIVPNQKASACQKSKRIK